jgi:hypothetical protein
MCYENTYPLVWLTPALKLGLNVPIRQGQTRYQYLVMQFTREEEITAELNMSECVSPSFTLSPN